MIIFNPTEHNIFDYPIQDKETKDVKLWSIKSGETLDFPDYVGEYFLEVYGFLQRIVTKEELEKEREEKKKLDAGKHFSQVKIVEAKPTGKVIPPNKYEGFTNEQTKTPANIKTEPINEETLDAETVE